MAAPHMAELMGALGTAKLESISINAYEAHFLKTMLGGELNAPAGDLAADGRMIRVEVPWASNLPSAERRKASAVAIWRPRLSTRPSQRTGPPSGSIGRVKFTLVSTVV